MYFALRRIHTNSRAAPMSCSNRARTSLRRIYPVPAAKSVVTQGTQIQSARTPAWVGEPKHDCGYAKHARGGARPDVRAVQLCLRVPRCGLLWVAGGRGVGGNVEDECEFELGDSEGEFRCTRPDREPEPLPAGALREGDGGDGLVGGAGCGAEWLRLGGAPTRQRRRRRRRWHRVDEHVARERVRGAGCGDERRRATVRDTGPRGCCSDGGEGAWVGPFCVSNFVFLVAL
ncbi:hypothetical protein B0H10DRAFT_1360760 [Mycena sp. CBHHK59/15]|nr:hypothetical protein B0H10DRAFT_1360760 [Mycena sp. CBHHK59/15]